MGGTLGVMVVVSAAIWLAAVVLLWVRPAASLPATWYAALAGGLIGAVASTAVWPDRSVPTPTVITVCLVAGSTTLKGRSGSLSPVGSFAWFSWLSFGALTTVWGVGYLLGLELSTSTTVLLWSAVALSAVTLPSAVITTREGWGPLLRASAPRHRPGPLGLTGSSPRVSVHVPCHAEPPEVVISTLDKLAELEYDNVEVLVVDNNTQDESLWRPVAEHCTRLGPRFRFFHVEGLAGAKAGALNWVLPHTDPAAELIAVVDADYHVEPWWLRETVGHFTDAEVGFVQAPHAYRDHEQSRFASWANLEYAVFFQTGMVSLDEAGAGLTVGTMSLIRKSALVRAGGWAEWCLTEDSELSIRIHDAGFSSVYLTEAYGRGLVPDTFEAYRRQRFRWTFGPVQEFRHHWRRFLPWGRSARYGTLTPSQKLHHANHGIDVIGIGVRALALLVGVVAGLSMVVHREVVPVPFELWVGSTAALVSSWAMRLLVYRRAVGATVVRALGAVVAFASLSLVITVSSLRATLGLSSAWHRTNKFRPESNWRSALRTAAPETVASLSCWALAAAVLGWAPERSGVALMLAIALAAKGFTYATAPFVSFVADRDLRAGRRRRAGGRAGTRARRSAASPLRASARASVRVPAPRHRAEVTAGTAEASRES